MATKKSLWAQIALAVFFSCLAVDFLPFVSEGATRPDAVGIRGVVTSAHSLASMAGLSMLLKGGNAFDAAVAVASTVNVVEPHYSGIGGNGFMTIYVAQTKKVYSLHMTGAVPYAAYAEGYGGKDGQDFGYKAGCVPGNFGGWLALLDKYGTMSLGQVLEPAIAYAEKGFPISPLQSQFIKENQKTLALFPTSAKIFLPNGKVPQAGELLVQKDLAKTFKRLVAAETNALKAGKKRSQALQAAFDLFYKGKIAKEFAAFYKENGGFFKEKDFAEYKPMWGKPVHTTYRGYDVYSNSTTSRGGIQTIMALNLLEAFDLKSLGQNSTDYLHLLAETIKVVNADVYKYVGDPKFTKVPLQGMLSKEYANARRKLIDLEKAMPYPAPGNPAEKTAFLDSGIRTAVLSQGKVEASYEDSLHTTHFDIVDKKGNAVACTPTLGSAFGTRVIVGDTGVFFNNGTRWGSVSPYKEDVNFVGGGKIPLLNNSPIVILKDGKPFMVFGTPGGEGIGQTQIQTMLNVLEFRMPIQEAIEAPRFVLNAKPDFYKAGAEVIFACEPRIDSNVVKGLEAKGHKVELDKKDYSIAVGGMQGILVNQANGSLSGGGDPRRGGYAIGY